MQIFKRRISNWWLVLIVLVLLLTPFALIVGGHVVGGIVGPPAVWRMPRKMPDRELLVGTYVESSNNIYGASSEYANVAGSKPGSAEITLNEDGLMTVQDLPVDDTTGSQSGKSRICLMSGTGRWEAKFADPGESLSLFLNNATSPSLALKSCDPKYGLSAAFMGQSKPYAIYLGVGDPDSGVGIEFRQTK
jgi:hypothetical protein